MKNPQRIQLRRSKGWRKPEGVVVVSRPSRWGNPFRLEDYTEAAGGDERKARERMVRDFRRALREGELRYSVEDVEGDLRGKDLACWCPLDQPCHADVLLDLANRHRRARTSPQKRRAAR